MDQTQQIDSDEHAYWRGEWEREAADESASELTAEAARAIAAQWAGWLPNGADRRALLTYAQTGEFGMDLVSFIYRVTDDAGLCLPARTLVSYLAATL